MKGNTIFVVIFTVIIILIAVANFFKLQALKIVFSVLLISIIEPQTIGINTILFECISAISTTGLSMGITTSLSAVSQLILIALMYVGRVGLTTVVLAISAKSEVINEIEYTNTDIIIG